MHNLTVGQKPTLGRKADRRETAMERGTHLDNGWPHYSSNTGLCICLDPCCNGGKGCKCKFCPCQIAEKDHSELLSILGSTISLHGMGGKKNGLPKRHGNGGKSNNGSRMADIRKMKLKIVINTRKAEDRADRRSLVWEGELEILDKEEYLMMISAIAEGEPQPICQVPFAIGIGHYLWIPPDPIVDRDMGDYQDE